MHIVILADAADNQKAGIHVYTKNIIENLLKIDKKNRYTFIHNKENPFFDGTEHYIVKRRKIPGGESFRRFVKFPNLIKKLKPDIVWEPCHIGPFRLPKGIKRVVTIHDITPVLFPELHVAKSVLIHRIFLRRVLKNADLILVPSKKTKEDIVNKYGLGGKIKVVNLAVGQSNFGGGTKYLAEPYILCLGTIEPRKNLQILIEAFVESKREMKIPHKLILAGEVGWKSKKLLKNLPEDILVTGFVNEKDKASLYRHAEFFVFPSKYEGFGFPPLEAMNYGKAVIASNGGSLKEFLNTKTLQFDPDDKETLKKHILTLVNNDDLRRDLAEKGLEYAKNFTWEKTARETLKALENLF